MAGKRKSAIVNDMDFCIVCGKHAIDIHHIFYGTANRQLSEKYRYIVPLCREHHTGPDGIHFDKAFDLHLKRTAQRHFEAGINGRDEFIRIFGRSYL